MAAALLRSRPRALVLGADPMASDKAPSDYTVGYGKPPEHSRFRKGQSGNPRGKVKGRKSLKAILAEELSVRMTIGINGKQVTASRQQLMVQTLTARAAAGDTRAAKMVIELVLQVFGADGQDGAPALVGAGSEHPRGADRGLWWGRCKERVRRWGHAMTVAAVSDPQALLDALCRERFEAFLRKAWPWINGGEVLLWNWHIDAIAHRLDQVTKGDSRRLIVNLPPRNGKSNIVSVIWVAWRLGHDPGLNFVCVSYSNELSGKLARDCRAIIEAPWYRRLFPKTVISARRSASHDFRTTAGGGRLATSITGTLTGRGGDIIILDDVIKPEDAASEVARTNVNNWYQSTLASRLNDKASGAILCVMQRLHQFDLCAMLLEAGGWDQLALPAIAIEDERVPLTRGRIHHREPGEALHSERESLEVLEELRADMGSLLFSAQYQQSPVPVLGNVIHKDWLLSYTAETAAQLGGQIIQSWDSGIKIGASNDWSVCVTAKLWQRRIYVIDVWRGRLEFPELYKKCIELARLHRGATLLIEDKASGQQLIQSLRADKALHVPMPVACTPEQDKLSRTVGVSAMIEAGQLLLPEAAHWLADFTAELMAFPNGKHDDQVDALTQLLNWARRQMSYDCGPPAAPILFSLDADGRDVWSDDPDYDDDGWAYVDDPWGP
jgi:predicted phage terminase large subunit-like protein